MVVTLDCERKNITGSFDCSKAPVARIADGDSVVCNVLDGDWHLGKPPVPKTGAGSFFEGKDAQRDAGHCLIGPIYVEGAKPAIRWRSESTSAGRPIGAGASWLCGQGPHEAAEHFRASGVFPELGHRQ